MTKWLPSCTNGTYILNGNVMVLINVQKTEASYIYMLTYNFSFSCEALNVILICLLHLIMPTLLHTNKKLPLLCTKVLKNNGEQQKYLESTCLQLQRKMIDLKRHMCEHKFMSSNSDGSSCVLEISCISIEDACVPHGFIVAS